MRGPEALRHVFKVKGTEGKNALDRWLAWAARCRSPEFTGLAKRIKEHRATLDATLEHGLSNALIQSTNTKIRLITRTAYGFANPQALIALALLSSAATNPPSPAETNPRIQQESPNSASAGGLRRTTDAVCPPPAVSSGRRS